MGEGKEKRERKKEGDRSRKKNRDTILGIRKHALK